jgi:hypothetical protein
MPKIFIFERYFGIKVSEEAFPIDENLFAPIYRFHEI